MLRLLCPLLLIWSAGLATAEEPREVFWNDLAPAVEPYDDPFSAMPYESISALARLLGIESLSPGSQTEAQLAEAAELRQTLTADGYDVDYLFAQRKVVMEGRMKAETEPNPALLDQEIRLPGYLLPLEFEGRKAVEFLLVPTVGACIHTPPPPANQVVVVRYDDGFEANGLFEPVWITGKLRAKPVRRDVPYSDGQGAVSASYTMSAQVVEPYK